MYKRANANFSDLIHPPKAHLASLPTPVTLLKELNKESPVKISVVYTLISLSFYLFHHYIVTLSLLFNYFSYSILQNLITALFFSPIYISIVSISNNLFEEEG